MSTWFCWDLFWLDHENSFCIYILNSSTFQCCFSDTEVDMKCNYYCTVPYPILPVLPMEHFMHNKLTFNELGNNISFFKIESSSQILFPIRVMLLYETDPVAWRYQCWICTHEFPAVYGFIYPSCWLTGYWVYNNVISVMTHQHHGVSSDW